MTDNIANAGGRDLFASHREVAWHQLGNVFEREITDSEEMLREAGLDWTIEKRELVVAGVPDATFYVPSTALVANIGGEERVLGIVSDRYEVVDNAQAFAFLQSLYDGARWETAGAIRDGRTVFGSMAFERDFVLDPNGVSDVVQSYLLVHTRHDGTGGVGGGVTPVRVVCKNTLGAALGNISSTFSIKHTASAVDKMDEQAAMWRHAHTYMDRFEEEARRMFETDVTDRTFEEIVGQLAPKPAEDKGKAALTRWEGKVDLYRQSWNGEPNAGIKGTAWGVFNTLTEVDQWGRQMRDTENGEENFYAAGAGLDKAANDRRSAAFALAAAL